MKNLWIAAITTLCCHVAFAHPQVEVNVPAEVLSSNNHNPSVQPCMQCCIYQNQNYSEGAVIKTEGVLLQCQRDEKILGTNPLVWKQINP